MRKKGGMELSINAIVILIIAMVVLGIGILFIRGMFAKAQTTTFKALSAQDTANPASADRPFMADREVTLSPTNPTATVAVSAYNVLSGSSPVNITLTGCKNSTGGDVNTTPGSLVQAIGYTPVTGTLSASSFSGYQTTISMLKNTTGQYLFKAGDVLACNLDATIGTGTTASTYPATVIVKIAAS